MRILYAVMSNTSEEEPVHSFAEFSLQNAYDWTHNRGVVDSALLPRLPDCLTYRSAGSECSFLGYDAV
jgi:hypothetical protein